MDKLVSIVTPTFNRADLLVNCYNSLIRQTLKTFEWIIVDDGSTDKTELIVKKFINENLIDIKYIYKSNGGKHRALNLGIELSIGKFTLILDSDDYLTDNCIEAVNNKYLEYKEDLEICGFLFLKSDSQFNIIGDRFEVNEAKSNINELINNNIRGDKVEVYYTEILKLNKFPEVEEEKFIGESTVWIPIGLKYKLITVNEVVYICEYLEGGLTKLGRKLRVNNPLGGMIYSQLFFDKRFKLQLRIKYAILYNVYQKIAKYKNKDYEKYKTKKERIMLIFTKIPAFFIYLKWKKLVD